MLHKQSYDNPPTGVWGTFERERERLNRRELEPGFAEGSGLAPEELRTGFYTLRDNLAAQCAVIRKARLFEYLLKNARIAVDPGDWFADKLDHQNLMQEYNSFVTDSISALYVPGAKDGIQTAALTGYYETGTGLDTGHVSPGWRYMLGKGLSGLLQEARAAREQHGAGLTAGQAEFYDALEIVYNAITAFCKRLSDMAASLADTQGEADAVRLRTIADSLRNVPLNPPAGFHEALQFTYIMHQMIELEGEWVRSMGGFDRNFFAYYDADIKAGRLTRDNAKELIKFYFVRFFAHTRGRANGKNHYFGGQNFDGSNAENELTYTALEAYHEMNVTDPKMSVRFFKGSTDRLYKQVTETIRAGRTAFVLVNDEVAVPAILAQGKTPEEAREYLLIGCYEPAIEGLEVACNMAISLNLAKGIELVLNRGADIATGRQLGPETADPLNFTTYDEFEQAYFTQLRAQVDDVTGNIRQYEQHWPLMNPSPVLAGTFADAVNNGRDIGQSGPKYNNTGCMGAGIGTAVDSLSAVKKAVFDDGVCTMSEMIDAIRQNFEGHEGLRRYLQYRIPRWGNGNPEADGIAKRLTETYTSYVNSIPNNRGGRFMPSLFSLDHRLSLGKHMSATPDGRLQGEPISLNNAASPGKDTEGVTALLRSLTCLDYKSIPNGSVTDVYLHPSTVAGEDGLAAFISLIKTYFNRGGYGIQFNIFGKETLIDAQKHPEKYETLQIRVCGWNVYFVTMSSFEQEQYINMNIHDA